MKNYSLLLVSLRFFIGVTLFGAQEVEEIFKENEQASQSLAANHAASPLMMDLFKGKSEKRSSEEAAFLLEQYRRKSDARDEDFFLQEENSDEEGKDHTILNTTSTDVLNCHDQKIEELKPKFFISRGYLNLIPSEFQAIAGPSRGPQSKKYNSLVKKLKVYKEEKKNKSTEEQLSFLEELAQAAKDYIAKKENSFLKETGKTNFEPNSIDRACSRIDACNLLLNGITVERLRLDNPVGSINYSPRFGRYIGDQKIESCEKHFAEGMISKLAHFKLNRPSSHEFIFKPESLKKEITELHAKQLGFSSELAATGITQSEANFSGRALATYKLAQLIGCDLVPEVMSVIFDLEGNEEIGNAQKYLHGKQLYEERMIDLSDNDLISLFGSLEQGQEYLAEVAVGVSHLQDGWKLCFPDSFEQIGVEKPLFENGEKITFNRALDLARDGKLSFQKKELYWVNNDIDFRDPILQKSLSNLQLLHLITGEQDPNPTNFIFEQEKRHWKAYSIDHDLSFPRDFTEIDDQFIEDRAFDKEIKYVLKKPLLIDQEMGEAILALTPEKVKRAMEETRLTQAEIEATLSRFTQLQEYIEMEKNSGGYVHDPIENEKENDLFPVSCAPENSLVWGKETYEILKEHPERSYVGSMLIAKKKKEKELAAILNKKNEIMETKEFNKANLFEPPFVPKVNRSVSESSSDSNISEQTTTTIDWRMLNGFTQALKNFNREKYIGGLRKEVTKILKPSRFSISTLNPFSNDISEEIKQLIVDHNTLLFTAGKTEEEAQSYFQALIDKNVIPPVNQDPWRELVRMFSEAESFCNKAVRALEEEQRLLPEGLYSLRKSYLQEVKSKQEVVAINLLWAQLYEAEHRAKLDQNSILKAQQAWRVLASNLKTPFKDLFEIWKKHIQVATSLTHEFTEFFPYWLEAIKTRHKSVDPQSTLVSQSIDHVSEILAWDHLLKQVYKKIATLENLTTPKEKLLWDEVLQEIGAQKFYTLAQQITTHILLSQKEIDALAQTKMIQIETHIATIRRLGYPIAYIELMSIVGVDMEKLKDLCSFWEQLKKDTELETRLWSVAAELASKLASNKKLKYEKSFRDHNKQSRLASFFYQVQQAEMLGDLAKERWRGLDESQVSSQMTSRASSPTFMNDSKYEKTVAYVNHHRLQKAIDNASIDQVVFELEKVKNLCEENLALGKSCYFEEWKPTFPSVKLSRFEELINPEATHYVFFNFYEEEVMKSFVNQINNFPDCAECKTALEEMLNRTSDHIKEGLDQACQKMETLQAELQSHLDAIVLLRGFGDI